MSRFFVVDFKKFMFFHIDETNSVPNMFYSFDYSLFLILFR